MSSETAADHITNDTDSPHQLQPPEDTQTDSTTDIPPVVERQQTPQTEEIIADNETKGINADDDDDDDDSKLLSPIIAVVLPDKLPGGSQPLFVSSSTQKIFQIEVDVDVSETNPKKILSKQAILDDIFNRAAVSDFQPLKKSIENYPTDEILLVYDHDFKFGQNFIICLTEEAKTQILISPVKSQEEVIIDDGDDDDNEKVVEEEEDDLGKSVLITRGPWVSLGSEKEIEEHEVVDTRPRISYRLQRKRIKFNQPVMFTTCSSRDRKELYSEAESYEDATFSINKQLLDMSVQASPCVLENCAQTRWPYNKNAIIQYSPRDDDKDAVSSEHILKDIIKNKSTLLEIALQQNEIMNIFRDDYLHLNIEDDTVFSVKSDAVLKEYQSFTDLQFSKDKTITCLDWHPTVKGLIAVSCAYKLSFDQRVESMHHILMNPSRVLIWSFVDPIHPMLMLEAPEDVICFKFNPVNPNIVVGGCINGYVVLWDISQHEEQMMANRGTSTETQTQGHIATAQAIFDMESKLIHAPIVRFCARSSIEHGHKNAVTDIHWVPSHMEISKDKENAGAILDNLSKGCTQIVSSSLDGTVFFWDTRPLTKKQTSNDKNQTLANPTTDGSGAFSHLDAVWRPFLYVTLPRSDSPGDFCPSRLSFREKHHTGKSKIWRHEASKSKSDKTKYSLETDAKLHSTKFFVGTEDGEIVCTDWMPVKDNESGRLISQKPEFSIMGHNGVVGALSRSPFFRDILLSVGGWTFCIWKEGVEDGPIFESSSSDVRRISGCWCPSRPAVFFIGLEDGYMEVWDLLDRSHEPILKQNISGSGLTVMEPYYLVKEVMLLALGDSSGTLHLLQLPWSLKHPSANELPAMDNYFERAMKALKYQKEREKIRNDERKQLESDQSAAIRAKELQANNESSSEEMKRAFDEYKSLEHKLLVELGIIQENEPED